MEGDLQKTVGRNLRRYREERGLEMRANIRSKLRHLDIKEERLLDLAAEADVGTQRLGERLRTIEMERGALQEKLATTNSQIERGIRMMNACLDLLVEPALLFGKSDDSARRNLLEAFFSGIWLDMDQQPSTEHSRQPDKAKKDDPFGGIVSAYGGRTTREVFYFPWFE